MLSLRDLLLGMITSVCKLIIYRTYNILKIVNNIVASTDGFLFAAPRLLIELGL